MLEQPNILISVHTQFARGIIAGTKRIELRRRAPKVPSGANVWLYSKAPVACVTAMATLAWVEEISPQKLWHEHRSILGLTEQAFLNYVDGRRLVGALHLANAIELDPVSLQEMRDARPGFHPPQYYARLLSSDPVLHLLSEALERRRPAVA